MKKNPTPKSSAFLFSLLFILTLNVNLFAGDEPKAREAKKNKKELETEALRFLKDQSVEFMENKGQMKDVAQNPVPFVLFKAEAPGWIYI